MDMKRSGEPGDKAIIDYCGLIILGAYIHIEVATLIP
jgi:hypothetical protein